MHNPFAGIEALFVDGENVSKYDFATIATLAKVIPKRLVYKCEFAAKEKYPGFERVKVERIGKESVDRAIGMDIVDKWHAGVRSVAMMSNDKGYGAAALYLKRKHPGLFITIICDECRLSRRYLERLFKAGIRTYNSNVELSDFAYSSNVELSDFSSQMISIIHRLDRKGQINLSQLGDELRAQGVAYKKGKLGQMLQDHGLVSMIQGHRAKITDLVRMWANKDTVRNQNRPNK